jgi:hypothetical protein
MEMNGLVNYVKDEIQIAEIAKPFFRNVSLTFVQDLRQRNL